MNQSQLATSMYPYGILPDASCQLNQDMWDLINKETGLIVDSFKEQQVAKMFKKYLFDKGQVEDERYIEILPRQEK